MPQSRDMDVGRPYRLAALVSHPIQYQGPFFREIAARPEIDLTVLYCSDWGLIDYRDEGFGQQFKWDIPLLEGYRSKFLPNVSPKPNPSRFWGLINPQIVAEVKKGAIDALWIHGWASCTHWLAILAAIHMRVPLLLRGESTLLAEPHGWKKGFKRVLLKWLFQRVTACLAIGRHNAEFYKAYGVPQNKVCLVPYAVSNDFFSAKAQELIPQKTELKRRHGIPPELPVILFTGKLVERKGIWDLLHAYARLSETLKAALVFVGDGPMRSELQQWVSSQGLQHVYFMGFQNQNALPRFYAMADLFVLPSRFEPWGLVVNEAMCFGLPVIVSDHVGASGDLVEEGKNGYIVPAGCLESLAGRLEQILSDARERYRMGLMSRQMVSQWSYTQGVNGILRCLENST